ncbi:MAG: LysE family translocator [Planctomyces sp.]|nr:LysE family translocator [Planctomyces sp.]
MADLSLVAGFALASFGISITPGPSWMYVLSTTFTNGRIAGLCAVAGNATGILGHVLATLLGLSSLITYEPRAYGVLRCCGALYLIYLGLRMLPRRRIRSNDPAKAEQQPVISRSAARAYRDGAFVNLLNPKVPILMLALMPQFIDQNAGAPEPQILLYGLMHLGIASCVLSTLVIASSAAGLVLKPHSKLRIALQWIGALILILFGARLAWFG